MTVLFITIIIALVGCIRFDDVKKIKRKKKRVKRDVPVYQNGKLIFKI